MSVTHPDRHCLDAETLGAWIDGGLDAASLAAAEAHVSSCERCQALVATMMKTLPADTAATPAGARLWRWWLAPIAAATAAVVVWAVVPQQSIAPSPSQPAPAPAPAAAAPPPPLERQEKLADASPSRRDANNDLRELRKESDPKRANAAPPVAAAPAPAAPPAETLAESVTVRQEKATDRAAALGAAAAPVAQLRRAASLEIVSPDPSRRWRSGADQGIERSVDGGRTWFQVRSPEGQTITAGSAPSPAVCWIVGADGLVLITADGNTFTRTASPTPADLIAVTATDARTATVTAGDGRTFRTDDGGATWRQN